MSKFIISGFADEIDSSIDIQLESFKKLGIDYFEIRGVDGKNISEISLQTALTVKQKADKYKIKISSIGSPVGKADICDDFGEQMRLLEHVADLAKVLGTKYIRVFSFYTGGENEKYRSEVISRMKTMAEFAEKKGIVLLHENEKGIYGDNAARCVDILKSVNSANLRAVFDFANFVQVGQVTYPDAFEMLAPYIEYVHIKDADDNGKVVPPGDGEGRIHDVLKILKKSGYEGFLSLEPHLGEFDGFAALEKDGALEKSDVLPFDRFALAHNLLCEILNKTGE